MLQTGCILRRSYPTTPLGGTVTHVTSEKQIRVAHITSDCEMQVNLASYGLDADQMRKVSDTLKARNDVRTVTVTNGWLHVKYNPKGLRGDKLTNFHEKMERVIKEQVHRKMLGLNGKKSMASATV